MSQVINKKITQILFDLSLYYESIYIGNILKMKPYMMKAKFNKKLAVLLFIIDNGRIFNNGNEITSKEEFINYILHNDIEQLLSNQQMTINIVDNKSINDQEELKISGVEVNGLFFHCPSNNNLAKKFTVSNNSSSSFTEIGNFWNDSLDTLNNYISALVYQNEQHKLLIKELDLKIKERDMKIDDYNNKLNVQTQKLLERDILFQTMLDKSPQADKNRVSTFNKLMDEKDAKIKTLEDSIPLFNEKIAILQSKFSESEKRSDVLISRAGKGHIRRDWQRIKNTKDSFPEGDDLKQFFERSLVNFESFAFDVIYSIQKMSEMKNIIISDKDAQNQFINIMRKIYDGCKIYIDNILDKKSKILFENFGVDIKSVTDEYDIRKLFWYGTLQEKTTKEIKNLFFTLPSKNSNQSDIIFSEEILKIMNQLNLLELHNFMINLTDEISQTENDIRIPSIINYFITMFNYCALSDPPCYLLPAPGITTKYNSDRHSEILSPGAKKYGSIQADDAVVVICPGLFFDNDDLNSKAVSVAKVTRVNPKLLPTR